MDYGLGSAGGEEGVKYEAQPSGFGDWMGTQVRSQGDDGQCYGAGFEVL